MEVEAGMKIHMRLVLILVLWLSPAICGAQFVSSLNWGYLYAKKIAINDTGTEFGGLGTWTNLDADIGFMFSDKVGVHVGFGGFKSTSTLAAGGAVAKLEAQNAGFPLFARVFFTEKGQGVRGFIEAGPSLNVQEFDLSASSLTGVGSLNIDGQEEKFGFTVGVGFVAPLSGGKLKIIPKARYNYVAKTGEFDASSFVFTIGIGFGRSL
jgi:hypothetical protein